MCDKWMNFLIYQGKTVFMKGWNAGNDMCSGQHACDLGCTWLFRLNGLETLNSLEFYSLFLI